MYKNVFQMSLPLQMMHMMFMTMILNQFLVKSKIIFYSILDILLIFFTVIIYLLVNEI